MQSLTLQLIYNLYSLAIFSYVVFIIGRSPWWFVAMVGIDLMFHTYLKSLRKTSINKTDE